MRESDDLLDAVVEPGADVLRDRADAEDAHADRRDLRRMVAITALALAVTTIASLLVVLSSARL